VAARWANGLVALANELIRTRAIDESTRNIAYLNRQLEQTNAIELRTALYDIVKNETKTLMLANGRTDYAFETVDPAVPPERKVGPHRAMMTLVGLAIGGVLGTIIAFIRNRIRRHRSGAPRPAGSA
jgi:LPS O-antigen subunit length determinant protein (WzzB/FepE family)